MPFFKTACIVAATLGLHISSTSPNPVSSHSEKPIAPTGLEFILASYRLRVVLRCLYWGVALIESVALLAQTAPQTSPSIWSTRILHILVGADSKKLNVSATPTLVVGSFLIVSGTLLRLQCYHTLGKHLTFETGILKNHKLVTIGPYQIVRHPSYSGAWIAYLGLMLYYYGTSGTWVMECVMKRSMLGRVLGWLYAMVMFLVVIGLTWRIPKEDEALKEEFGKDWEEWAAQRNALVSWLY
ncbi:hypothetical protein R3P38DRAFT_3559107 [Favolaschia claudopus]|uniref:Protein-S-isoprenylcysteine O-methyltransferase n=1 Tax=Favolaschia claudopus TaxID=2862362 RepID=A0AAW0AYC2_9AGAR